MNPKKNSKSNKPRGKILHTEYCFGDKNQIARQMTNTSKFNKRCQKPCWHNSLSFAPEDKVSDSMKIEIGLEYAQLMGFDYHQLAIISHKDSESFEHIHLVMNRVGVDGKNVVSTSHNYRKASSAARQIEAKYGLTPTQSPSAFLPPEERKRKRKDQKKTKMKMDLESALKSSINFEQLRDYLEGLNYQVIKNRGLAIMDSKKVRCKASELGYPYMKIEAILQENFQKQFTQSNNQNLEIGI